MTGAGVKEKNVDMKSTDMILLIIAIGACGFSYVLTHRHWVKRVKADVRSFDCCIGDIRAMNTYNSYFMAAIVIFLGFTLGNGTEILPKSCLGMLLSAFLFAATSMFFIPLEKPTGDESSLSAKRYWLFVVVLSQWVVILCVLGIVNAVLPRLLA